MTQADKLDEILDYIQLQMKKPVPSDIREEVVAVGDLIVKEEAKAALQALLVEARIDELNRVITNRKNNELEFAQSVVDDCYDRIKALKEGGA